MIFKTLWRSKPKVADIKAAIPVSEDNFKYKTSIEIRFADIDMMGHVNNATYFTYMEIARSKYWKHAITWDWEKTGVVIAKASIDYIAPVYLKDKITMHVRTSKIGTSSFELEYMLAKAVNGKEEVCAKGKTICVAFDYENKSSTPIPVREKEKMRTFEQL